MNKTRLKILVGVLIILAIMFAYSMFFSDDKGAVEKNVVSVGENANANNLGVNNDSLSSEGSEILVMLNKMKAIKLDTDFFNGKLFRGLTDFSIELIPEVVGRPNPFSPLSE